MTPVFPRYFFKNPTNEDVKPLKRKRSNKGFFEETAISAKYLGVTDKHLGGSILMLVLYLVITPFRRKHRGIKKNEDYDAMEANLVRVVKSLRDDALNLAI